jgi:hypothetical protein
LAEREFEDGLNGVVVDDSDLVDQGVEQGLAGVVGLVGEDVLDLGADGGQFGWGECLGWLFEVELEFRLAGTQCLRLALSVLRRVLISGSSSLRVPRSNAVR